MALRWFLFLFLSSACLSALTVPSDCIIIPAAAHAPGDKGTVWRTDLYIHNPSDIAGPGGGQEARLTLELIPSGSGGALADRRRVALAEPLAAGRSITIADVLGTYFPGLASGALIVWSGSVEGTPTAVTASTRTWTPNQEGGGTYGQGIPGIPRTFSDAPAYIAGLEQTGAFRTNLGLVNASFNLRQTFAIGIHDADGVQRAALDVTLEPWAQIQINAILAEAGLSGSGYSAVVRPSSSEDLDLVPGESKEPCIIAYGSRADQVSGDPTYLEARRFPSGSPAPAGEVIAAAARTEGGAGSSWRTDLTLFNPSETETIEILELDIIPSGGAGGAADPVWIFLDEALGPRETLVVEDVMGTHFPGVPVAALVVHGFDFYFDDLPLVASSRTWTPGAADAGSYGQGIPGVPRSDYGDAQVLSGLEATEAFRTNLGFVNLSMNLRETLRVDVFASDGTPAGSDTWTLEPWGHLQVNGILGTLGLSGSGYTAVVTVEATENLYLNPSESWQPSFLAYGSRVDMATNDPTYLSAVLVEREDEGGPPLWYDFGAAAPWYPCPAGDFPAEAVVVTAFDRAYHYFGAENHRDIVRTVEFPPEGPWNQVGLHLKLECPESGKCDHWDRLGTVQLVLNPEAPPAEWRHLELVRHVTPYRMGMCEYIDVTALAPLLTGTRTLQSFIDTWVGPGHSSGEGWLISVKFVFYPGPDRRPDQVIPVHGVRYITVGETAPGATVDDQTPPFDLALPPGASRIEARLITTGHSFGNTYNCAEFCMMRQDLYVNGTLHSVLPWRNDCRQNPVSDQYGTWTYPRNGWCPGAVAVGSGIDLTGTALEGGDNLFDFDIRMYDGEVYINTDPVDLLPYEAVSLVLFVYN